MLPSGVPCRSKKMKNINNTKKSAASPLPVAFLLFYIILCYCGPVFFLGAHVAVFRLRVARKNTNIQHFFAAFPFRACFGQLFKQVANLPSLCIYFFFPGLLIRRPCIQVVASVSRVYATSVSKSVMWRSSRPIHCFAWIFPRSLTVDPVSLRLS